MGSNSSPANTANSSADISTESHARRLIRLISPCLPCCFTVRSTVQLHQLLDTVARPVTVLLRSDWISVRSSAVQAVGRLTQACTANPQETPRAR